jgi:hypothetical protein
MAHWHDRVGRLESRPRKGVASKRISLAQRWCGGAPASKVQLLGLRKQYKVIREPHDLHRGRERQ